MDKIGKAQGYHGKLESKGLTNMHRYVLMPQLMTKAGKLNVNYTSVGKISVIV